MYDFVIVLLSRAQLVGGDGRAGGPGYPVMMAWQPSVWAPDGMVWSVGPIWSGMVWRPEGMV